MFAVLLSHSGFVENLISILDLKNPSRNATVRVPTHGQTDRRKPIL